MCDNCVNPKETFDGSKEMCLVIRLIKSLPEHFKIDHLALVLAGETNAMVKSYRHDALPLFGSGNNHSVNFWCAVVHQGLLLHLLEKEIETYGLIYVTKQGEDFLNYPYEVPMVEDRVFQAKKAAAEEDDGQAAGAAAMRGGGGDTALLSMLKSLRKDLSRKLNLQPWIIFGDPALEDMSILYPISYKELCNCQGVGEGKARKYGKEFIELIKRYVDENDITRPEDFVVKSTPIWSALPELFVNSLVHFRPLCLHIGG